MIRRLNRFRHPLSLRRRTLALGVLLCLLIPLVALVFVYALPKGNEPQEFALWPAATATPESEWTKLVLTPEAQLPISLEAVTSDAAGVDPASAFLLKASMDIDEPALRKGFSVDPSFAFDIEKSDDRQFRVVPVQPLEEETLYRFQLTLPQAGEGTLSRSWAFQTRTPLRIVQTLPAQSATYVPLNTGIELTFTYDGVNDITPFLEITPPTAGRVEIHKRVAVFVPESLQADTLYTVTVHKGVGLANSALTMTDDFSFQFETGETGRTGDTPLAPQMVFRSRTMESSSSQPPALELMSHAGPAPSALSFAVYQYPGLDAFAAALAEYEKMPTWAYRARDSYLADTSGLSPTLSFEGQLETASQSAQTSFVRMPAPLPAGFYLIEANDQGSKSQGWLQVTDVAVHATVSKANTLIWVNDVAAHAPIAGASVALADGTALATTDSRGIAFFQTPAALIQTTVGDYRQSYVQAVQDLLVTDASGRQMLVPLGGNASPDRSGGFNIYPYTSGNDLYWNYLYVDRPLYQPSDTIHFWGVLKSRDAPKSAEQATIELNGGSSNNGAFYGFDDRNAPLATVSVTTDDVGAFTGDLSFVEAAPGYYRLSLKSGDTVITTQYLEIRHYTKPAYKIDVTPSEKAAFDGDKVDFNIDVAFFDGSPVPNVELVYGTEGSDNLDSQFDGTVTTDERGHAVVTIPAKAQEGSQYPSRQTLDVRPKAAEEGEIIGSTWIEVFPSALTIDANATYVEGAASISGTLRNVDLSHLDLDKPIYDYRDFAAGSPAGNRTVRVEVREESYTQVKTGDTYDFIRKMVVPLYQYDYNETPVSQSTLTTLSSGAFSYRLPTDPSKRYHVIFTSPDDQGRTAEIDLWVNSYIGSGYSNANARPRLVGAGTDGCPGQNPPYYEGTAYNPGDEVDMVMKYGADAAPGGDANRYLYLEAQNGLQDYQVQDSSALALSFSDRYAPNITVFGVWFTGETYASVSYGCQLRANTEPKRLQIDVTPGQERYQPGDQATLNVSVHDSSGQPVRADVNFSAVDEAIYRLQEPYDSANHRDILRDLYLGVSHGLIVSYGSHQYPGAMMIGGQGGGGGGARNDFEDVALFQTVTTDDQGQATVTFKLPDNLTSWRIITQGVTSDLKAGSTTTLLPVGLPFFVDLSMNDEYLTSDKPQIRLRAFGEGLSEGAEVSFEVTCPSLGIDEPIKTSGAAFQPVDVALSELRVGEHELTVTATAGDFSDSLTRKFRVVQSRLLRAQSQFYQLTPDLVIEGASDGRTTVVFTDNNRGRYYPLLRQLSWTWGDRVDQMLARNLSHDLLKQYFGDDEAPPAVFDPASYQTPDGGIALFPYAAADLTVSARLAALAPGRFAANSSSPTSRRSSTIRSNRASGRLSRSTAWPPSASRFCPSSALSPRNRT